MAEQQRTGNERAAASDAGLGADAAARPKDVLAAARCCIERRGLANAETPVLLMCRRLGLHGAGVHRAATGR